MSATEWIGFAALIVMVAVLTGCDATVSASTPLVVYTDNITGCQYLGRSTDGGLTPRMDRHGKHICTER